MISENYISLIPKIWWLENWFLTDIGEKRNAALTHLDKVKVFLRSCGIWAFKIM